MSPLAVAVSLLALPAAAQDRPLTDAEVLDLAHREAVWCENWSEATRDCDSLYMLRQEADGTLVQAGMFLFSETPRIQVFVAEPVALADGRLCSSGSTDELNIRATLDGRPSPEATMMIRALFAEAMADFAEAEICQQLLSAADPEAMGEIITADGERLTDFESTYRLGTLESGFLLRPMAPIESEDGQVTL